MLFSVFVYDTNKSLGECKNFKTLTYFCRRRLLSTSLLVIIKSVVNVLHKLILNLYRKNERNFSRKDVKKKQTRCCFFYNSQTNCCPFKIKRPGFVSKIQLIFVNLIWCCENNVKTWFKFLFEGFVEKQNTETYQLVNVCNLPVAR